MKKLFASLLILLTITSMFSCASDEKEKKAASKNESSTLMIYMVGSDLEAKGGSATSDLEEIANSGIDLSSNNVIIYAGGTKKWHNESVTTDEEHSVLELGKDGYSTVATFDKMSMGDAQCLAGFLNYAYENYKSDSYSLILWNHGMGPLIGYGKDMFFDGDSLTLMDMKTALEASPFKDDNKLSLVGFDACLMSSAELACVWADHSEFLVASQEIEPAFGWNYSFLADYGKIETNKLIKSITDDYFKACEEYFDKKGYEDRDTTLACMDLSHADKLSDSINKLFKSAFGDVELKYNELSLSRVNTRALGRASTGSEYDLIDIYDMSEQLKDKYPDEVSLLQSVLDDMIIINSTNAENLCGMSIYYPFYNKQYFEKSWKEAYTELNVFPEYGSYLDKYTSIWLKDDLVDALAESVMPNMLSASQYTLTLTEEQAKAYTDSRYYILQKEGEGLYTRLFSSNDVTRDGNTLTANFDGNIIYAKNKFDDYFIPVMDQHDTVGNTSRYSTYLNLTNNYVSLMDAPEDFEQRVEGHRFHLAVNNATKEIKTSALVPWNQELSANELSSGKIEDADLTQWSEYFFLQEGHKYLSRYENGAIKPLDSWPETDFLSANVVRVGDGLEFTFAPLVEGEYYLMFEVDDSQGNSFCSELLTINSDAELEYKYEPRKVIDVNWEKGEKVELLNEQGITIWLTFTENYLGEKIYTFTARNANDFDIYISGGDLFINEKMFSSMCSTCMFTVKAGETITDDIGFSFGDLPDMKLISELRSLQFNIDVYDLKGTKTLIKDQGFNVSFSDTTAVIPSPDSFIEGYYDYNMHSREAFATEQIIFEYDSIKGSILGLGGNESNEGSVQIPIKLENTSDSIKYMTIDGFTVNNIFVEKGSGPITLYPGLSYYKIISINNDTCEEYYIDAIESVNIDVRFSKYATLEGGGGFAETRSYPIILEEKGSATVLDPGSTELYNKNGITLTIKEYTSPDDHDLGYFEWYCILTNNSSEDISINLHDVSLNGESVNTNQLFAPVSGYGGKCKAGTVALWTLTCDAQVEAADIKFMLDVSDFNNEKILWEDDTVISVKSEG